MNPIRSTLLAAFGLLVIPLAANATVILDFTGTTPDVKVQAALTISGDTLTVMLTNDSASIDSPTSCRDELLTSFYFDIVDGSNNRPTLTYVSATGDVHTGDETNPDPLQTAGADLLADSVGDDTWQFKQGLSLSAGTATLTFGIGTVGNKQLTPDGFDTHIVHREEYGIYAGDISSHKLDGAPLVNTTATFIFSGVAGWTEEDISKIALFGLGKKPDSMGSKGGVVGVVPEPASALPLGMGLSGLVWAGRGRRHG